MVLYQGKTCKGKDNMNRYLEAARKASAKEGDKPAKLTLKQKVAEDNLDSLGEFEYTHTNGWRLQQLAEDATKMGAVKILTALQIFSEKLKANEDNSQDTIDKAISEANALFAKGNVEAITSAISEANALFAKGNVEAITSAISKAFAIGGIPANIQKKLDELETVKDGGEDSPEEDHHESGMEPEDSGESFTLDTAFELIQNGSLELKGLFESEIAGPVLEGMADHMQVSVAKVKSSIALQLMYKAMLQDKKSLVEDMYGHFESVLDQEDMVVFEKSFLMYKVHGSSALEYESVIACGQSMPETGLDIEQPSQANAMGGIGLDYGNTAITAEC